jgi:polysaccharide chain length determinant protein (PEP-CTERM system associated)
MLIAVDPQRVPDAIVRSTVTLGTDRRLEALKVKVLSRTALEQLIEEFDLYPEERTTMPLEDVVAKLRANIDMVMQIPRPRWGEEPQPTAFRVQFIYWDPEKATKVAQRVGAYFVEQNILDRGALAGATNKFLENQLAASRVKLEEQERRLESFRQQHGQELPTQITSNLQALTSAQTQVQAIVESAARDRDRKLMLERLYREAAAERVVPVTAAGGTRQSGTGNTVTSGSLQSQLAEARANLAGLELRYKADHPDVVRTKRLIAELEPKAAAEAKAVAAAAQQSNEPGGALPAPDTNPAQRESLRQMRAEIESLDRQLAFKESEERRVRAEISEYQRRVEAVPGLESEWVALTRDYDTQQIAYRELLTKAEAAKLAANLEEQNIGERFRIVDPAVVPVRPLPSQRIRYNAVGLAIGLLIGLGLAVLLELRDKSFRTEADVLDVLSLPVLATVPYIETAAEKVRGQRRRMAVSAAGVTCLAVAGYVAWTLKLWKSVL